MTANARTEANGRATLRLRTEMFDERWRVIFGPMTIRQQAEDLGIDHRHWSQLRTGTRNPGATVIAAIRKAMPNVPYEELWDVVEPTTTGDAA